MMIHLRSASQQCLVVALTTLPTIESHMVPYKYTRKAFQQFPCTLAGDSPKWNILVVTWALVICLKYTHSHSGCALVLMCIFQANHSCPCYNYYIMCHECAYCSLTFIFNSSLLYFYDQLMEAALTATGCCLYNVGRNFL